MRLIDADLFKQQMSALALTSPTFFTSKVVKLLEIIDKQPTAYDVEEVVEELEEMKGQAFLTLANTGDAVFDFTYDNVLAYLDKVIEIVRKGGEEDEKNM